MQDGEGVEAVSRGHRQERQSEARLRAGWWQREGVQAGQVSATKLRRFAHGLCGSRRARWRCLGSAGEGDASSIGAPDQRVSFEGSYLPFPKNDAERAKTGDPRKSIAERYANAADYSAQYEVAVDKLIKGRFILPEDKGAILKRGEQEWAEATK